MNQMYLWWQRLIAQAWFIWGQSISYWGNRLVSKTLYEWAVRAYGRAVSTWPEHAQAYCRRGVIRGRELNDYTGAVRDLTVAIELGPEWPEPYLQRGLLHRFHGAATAERALADLRRYLELGPSEWWRVEVERQIANIESEIAERQGRVEGNLR